MRGTEIGSEALTTQSEDQREGAGSLSGRGQSDGIDAFSVDTARNEESRSAPSRAFYEYVFHYVYEIIDPRINRVVYVGYTTSPRDRLSAHGHDPNSAVWSLSQDLRAVGLRPIMRIVARYRRKVDARREEQRRIAITPNLLNRSNAFCLDAWIEDQNPSPEPEQLAIEPDGDYLEYKRLYGD